MRSEIRDKKQEAGISVFFTALRKSIFKLNTEIRRGKPCDRGLPPTTPCKIILKKQMLLPCCLFHGNSIYFYRVMVMGGAKHRNRNVTVTSKHHKPYVSVRGVERGQGK